MIYGEYVIRQDGKEIVVPNILTTVGKQRVLQHLAGQLASFADFIGVGVVNTTPVVGDTTLGFQIDRYGITTASPDYPNNNVHYKAVIPAPVSLDIYELGLWGIDNDVTNINDMLFTFENDVETWTVGTYTTNNARVGDVCLQVPVTTTATTKIADIALDFSQLGTVDQFALAAQSTGSVTINLRFKTSDTDYFQSTAVKAAGYTVTKFSKTGTVVGSPDWSNIVGVDIVLTATSDTVFLDAIQLNMSSLTTAPVLISRAVLSTPKLKLTSSQMDLEYRLGVTFV